jgi:GT2 family glycosyltransferase
MPHFIERLVEASRVDSSIGVTCGKLLRADPDLLPAGRVIDSAGMYFTPSMRHFDRGWNEPDDGRYSNTEYVFGASAAAALYRREMIDDISLEDGFFDPDFFVYREDADVAWRAQLLGWRCLYAPLATALHVRTMRPDSRRRVAPVLRMHSVKNRFLMRVKNATADLYGRFWLPATARDFLILSGCLLCEQGSLPALWHAATSFRRAAAKRRWIMGRRRAGDEYMAAWFDSGPAGWPVDGDVRGPERQLARAATP